MAWDRRIYDRKRAIKIYKDFKKRRVAVFKLFGNKCFLCEKKAVKGFHLHHIKYHPTESNYQRHSKSMWPRLKRLKEAEDHPERFILLCPKHHLLVEFAKRSKLTKEIMKKLMKLI